MKRTILYNFFTSLAILMCVSCAHQGSKRAAMDSMDSASDDLAQESSGAPEVAKQEKDLTSLEATKEEAKVAAKEEAPAAEVALDVLGTELASNDVAKKEEAPVAEVASAESKVDERAAEEAVASMLQLGSDEKSLALEEIKKVDVVPSVETKPVMVVASEDKVNADLEPAPAEAVSGDTSNNETLPAPGHERELSNDSKSNAEPSIETEPVPAPAKKSPKKQGSENRTKKNRVETVAVPMSTQKVVANLDKQALPLVPAKSDAKPVKKQDAKLASAEISEFITEHYLSVGLLVLLSVLLAYRLTRRNGKQDENFPL